MSNAAPQRVRVTLRWIQILDIKEPFFRKAGQFKFVSTVSTGDDGRTIQKNLPESGHLTVSESFAQNKVTFDTVIFEGEVGDRLSVALEGEEVDRLSKNDPLPSYRRDFSGSPAQYAGWYGPGDEAPEDEKENLGAWRVCYEIEQVD